MSHLEVKDLSKKFGSFYAVKNISFSLSDGDILGFLGPNGSGKTTTIKMLTALINITSGKILLDNKDIKNNIYEYKKRVGYVPESGELYSHLSGYEYLMFSGQLRQIEESSLGKKIESLADLLNTGTDIHNSISSYSKGTAQKILIISAIISNPKILFFDEPLNGLDINTILIVKELILKLSQSGKIIIYSSHILETVEKICSRIIVIDKGCLVDNKKIDNFKKNKENINLESFFKTELLSQNEKAIADDIVQLIISE